MALGYDGKLYILAFDHRGSFQKKFFGVEGTPTPEDTQRIIDAKTVIFDGARKAIADGIDQSAAGVLVDEQFGTAIANAAKQAGIMLAMPCEKSGQNEFDFEYGAEFASHIQTFDPAFTKVLVRYNPAGDGALNARQSAKLKELSDWLHANNQRFLFELLVPAEESQLASVDGDVGRYDREVRPDLMRMAIAELQESGVEADIWKIEGIDATEECEAIVEQAPDRRARPRGVHRARPRRGRRRRGQLAAGGARGRRLLRLRDRALDLVGRAEGLRGRLGAAPGDRGEDRHQLPAVRHRVRGRLIIPRPAGRACGGCAGPCG